MKRPFTLVLRRPVSTKCSVSPISDGMSVKFKKPTQNQEQVLIKAVDVLFLKRHSVTQSPDAVT